MDDINPNSNSVKALKSELEFDDGIKELESELEYHESLKELKSELEYDESVKELKSELKYDKTLHPTVQSNLAVHKWTTKKKVIVGVCLSVLMIGAIIGVVWYFFTRDDGSTSQDIKNTDRIFINDMSSNLSSNVFHAGDELKLTVDHNPTTSRKIKEIVWSFNPHTSDDSSNYKNIPYNRNSNFHTMKLELDIFSTDAKVKSHIVYEDDSSHDIYSEVLTIIPAITQESGAGHKAHQTFVLGEELHIKIKLPDHITISTDVSNWSIRFINDKGIIISNTTNNISSIDKDGNISWTPIDKSLLKQSIRWNMITTNLKSNDYPSELEVSSDYPFSFRLEKDENIWVTSVSDDDAILSTVGVNETIYLFIKSAKKIESDTTDDDPGYSFTFTHKESSKELELLNVTNPRRMDNNTFRFDWITPRDWLTDVSISAKKDLLTDDMKFDIDIDWTPHDWLTNDIKFDIVPLVTWKGLTDTHIVEVYNNKKSSLKNIINTEITCSDPTLIHKWILRFRDTSYKLSGNTFEVVASLYNHKKGDLPNVYRLKWYIENGLITDTVYKYFSIEIQGVKSYQTKTFFNYNPIKLKDVDVFVHAASLTRGSNTSSSSTMSSIRVQCGTTNSNSLPLKNALCVGSSIEECGVKGVWDDYCTDPVMYDMYETNVKLFKVPLHPESADESFYIVKFEIGRSFKDNESEWKYLSLINPIRNVLGFKKNVQPTDVRVAVTAEKQTNGTYALKCMNLPGANDDVDHFLFTTRMIASYENYSTIGEEITGVDVYGVPSETGFSIVNIQPYQEDNFHWKWDVLNE